MEGFIYNNINYLRIYNMDNSQVTTGDIGFLKEYMQEKFKEVGEKQKDVTSSVKDVSKKLDDLGVDIRANYATQKDLEEVKSDLKGLKTQLWGFVALVLTFVIGQILTNNFSL